MNKNFLKDLKFEKNNIALLGCGRVAQHYNFVLNTEEIQKGTKRCSRM